MFNKKEKLQDKGNLQEPVISSYKKYNLTIVTLDFGVPVKKLEYKLSQDKEATSFQPRLITQGHWCETMQSEHRVPGYGLISVTEIPLSLTRQRETKWDRCTYILDYKAHGFSGDIKSDRMMLNGRALYHQRQRRKVIQDAQFIDGWVNLYYLCDKKEQESTIDFEPLLNCPAPEFITKVEYALYQKEASPNQNDVLTTLVEGDNWYSGNYPDNEQIKISGYADQIGIKVHFKDGDTIWRVFDLRSQRYDIEKQLGESFPHEKAVS